MDLLLDAAAAAGLGGSPWLSVPPSNELPAPWLALLPSDELPDDEPPGLSGEHVLGGHVVLRGEAFARGAGTVVLAMSPRQLVCLDKLTLVAGSVHDNGVENVRVSRIAIGPDDSDLRVLFDRTTPRHVLFDATNPEDEISLEIVHIYGVQRILRGRRVHPGSSIYLWVKVDGPVSLRSTLSARSLGL